MSSYYYLFCEQTNECIEVVATVGAKPGPRIDANALQAFLVYHHMVASQFTCPSFTLENIDDISDATGRISVTSLDEMKQYINSNSWIDGYTSPILIWTEDNYKSLADRANGLASRLSEYENAPSGGIWVRKTVDGRII